MTKQFAKIVAVLMVLAMAVSVFGLCASAAEETTEANVVLLGDVNLNGEVTISDATLIQKALAKLATLDETQTTAADATEDGEVNIKDTTMIQKWLAKFEDANQNIGQPIKGASDDETSTPGEATPEESTPGEATPEESTPGEATPDEDATKDEETPVEPSTKDEETPVDPATKDEETPVDPATKDEATEDEATADEAAFYLVGWINNADVYDTTYTFVNGTVTVEFTADSYVAVQDENGTVFWTDGWLDFNPTSAVLGEFGANNNKFHVAAGTVTFTWDAATCTLAVA